ncbi:hypothetical protein BC829DRAFT_389697 [Chytridium lagenaria]|nr:hypothetical protein BC829DRAFT_389697 [Chytridium lagenaria]
MKLARSEVGYKAIGLFINHVLGLARRRVSLSSLFAHPPFTSPKEVAAVLPFSDLDRDRAHRYFVEQLRINFGLYTPVHEGGTLADSWAMDPNPIIDVASAMFFESIYTIVGGRAADLNAIAGILALTESINPMINESLGSDATDSSISKSSITKDIAALVEERITYFPDIFASVRWLEERLHYHHFGIYASSPDAYHTDPHTFLEQTGPSLSSTTNLFHPTYPSGLLIHPHIPYGRFTKPWFIGYSEALSAMKRATRDVSESDACSQRESVEKLAGRALRSLILHGVVAYRPQGFFYFDGCGSGKEDGIAPIRPKHVRPKFQDLE